MNLADFRHAYSIAADGTFRRVDPSTPETVAAAVDPVIEDPRLLDSGLLPGGRRIYFDGTAELYKPLNRTATGLLGRAVHGTAVLMPQ